MRPPPPPNKKARLNIFAVLRRKLFSSVHVLLRSACRFSQLVISLKIMSLGKVNKKIGQGQAITLMYFCGVAGIDITGLVLSGLYSARHPPCQIDRQNFTIHFVQISP